MCSVHSGSLCVKYVYVYVLCLSLQDMRVGTGRGVLLAEPETHNVDVGCNVTSSCETDGASLCPADKSSCISSWNASSCHCLPGMSLTFTFAMVVLVCC